MMDMMQLVHMIRQNGTESALRQMANQHPVYGQALKMIQGKSPEQINQMAANIAREKGVDIGMLMQQIKDTLGMK